MKKTIYISIALIAIFFSIDLNADNTWESIYSVSPNITNCTAGSLTATEKSKLLNKINQIRKIHNLSLLTWEDIGDNEANQAALICASNGELNHEPPATYACYSQPGYNGASTSNLHLGFVSEEYLADSEKAVVGWLIDDKSASGDELGHRRAVINPFLEKVSFGRADGYPKAGDATQWFATAMSMKYQDYVANNSTNVTVDYVACPFQNYPIDFFNKEFYLSFHAIPNKTSLWSNAGVDYSNAQITMQTEAGIPITVSAQKYDILGWGSLPNCLQWKAAGLQNDVKYLVTINNVKYNAQTLNYSYWFKLTDEVLVEELATPTLLAPANSSTDLVIPPSLTWNSVQNASKYNVKIAKDANFTDIAVDLTNITLTNADFANAEKGTTYYWKVQALNETTSSQWSEAWSFTTKAEDVVIAPVLVFPQNNQGDIRPNDNLQWGAVAGANIKYRLQISESVNFDANWVLNQNGIVEPTYSLSALTLLTNKPYYWRVRAYTPDVASNWSSIFSFNTYNPASVQDSETLLSIAPNPTKDNILNLYLSSFDSDNLNIKIYSIDGQLLISDFMSISSNTNILPIDISRLSYGTYLINISYNAKSINKIFTVIK